MINLIKFDDSSMSIYRNYCGEVDFRSIDAHWNLKKSEDEAQNLSDSQHMSHSYEHFSQLQSSKRDD